MVVVQINWIIFHLFSAPSKVGRQIQALMSAYSAVQNNSSLSSAGSISAQHQQLPKKAPGHGAKGPNAQHLNPPVEGLTPNTRALLQQQLDAEQALLDQEQELQKQLYSGSNVAPEWRRVTHNNKIIYIRLVLVLCWLFSNFELSCFHAPFDLWKNFSWCWRWCLPKSKQAYIWDEVA